MTAADSGSRLGQGLLVYFVVAVLFVTWAPFGFVVPGSMSVTTAWTWSDLVLNVVMFLPLGFFWQASRPRGSTTPWWVVGLAGAALSLAIETGQLFLPERYSSPFDVVTNGLGAAVGARLFERVRPRLRVGAESASMLALELPLAGLALLLTPLLWVSGFGSVGTERVWLMLPLAAFGGAVLGAVHGAHLEARGNAGRGGLLVAVLAWFLVAALPGAASRPDVLLAGSIVALLAAWLRSLATARARRGGRERRVELPTLRLVLPFFAAYLVLSALWPASGSGLPSLLDGLDGSWRGAWTLSPAQPELTRALMMRTLEYLAAFTLVGYMTAEFHGRQNTRYGRAALRVFGYALVLVLVLEGARGWSVSVGASYSVGLLGIGAAICGGWLYHLQRDHVRTLLQGGSAVPRVGGS
ncbi:MAG: VanZ family protein [Gemmatimonadales bacterium]|nr:MAG: VanZ family protein [Gemmatimonadales bacterium]